ncbi:hypothetical protein [Turicibacter sanguinis]|uniref:hypothetical protein n=1 Tax=Turicibacter sanguinis TaxID=154288 RepID=UPI0012BC5D2D|nr:hypothetical protein [Turicibacter sanguinis]MDB8439085.1 hypothetical protein [Turicibacter sanguinis]MDB8553817.1 hypothetical protein [Turicibacter sanguinis]MTO25153.1 hypothetical protein [Turicibacter sanguinis]MTO28066.1 hypothetical protein [Turicibacter sanguinis]MTO91041.1 hypothetical protein [Turicibacter sanguinis]
MLDLFRNYEGIIGALLGVVVTTLLTEWIKSKGRLNFYFDAVNVKYMKGPDSWGICSECDSQEDYQWIEIEFEMQVYNSSEIKRILRDISIQLVSDNDTVISKVFLKQDKNPLKVLNLPPKEITEFHLKTTLNHQDIILDDYKEIKEIYVITKNEKNKVYKNLIKKF